MREAPHVVGQGKSKTPHGEYGEFETCSPANDVQLDGSHARRGLLTGPRWNEHVCGCAEIHACPIPGTRRLPAAGWKLGGAPSSVLRQGTVAVPTGHRSGLEPSAVWVRAAGPVLSAKNAGRRTCFSLRLIPVPARVGKDASTSLDIAILSTRAPPAARMTRPDFRRACACVGGCDELVDRCLSDEPAHCDGSASLPALLGLSSLKLQHTLLSPASTSSCMASVSAATSATDGEFFSLVRGGGGGFVWWWWWGPIPVEKLMVPVPGAAWHFQHRVMAPAKRRMLSSTRAKHMRAPSAFPLATHAGSACPSPSPSTTTNAPFVPS